MRQPSRQKAVPRRQPPRAQLEEPGDEFLVRQHGRNRALRLRGDEPEARHLAGAVHDRVVVRVHDPDPKTGETEILGEAVDNVDEIEIALRVFLHDVGNADEGGVGEDGGGVDFVADEVDFFSGGEG